MVKPHGMKFNTHERLVHRKKFYEYYLVPNSESREYNCISYSLGVTQSGLWPGWFWINECSEVKLSPINLKRVIISLI
jgi:hypothetical protein